VTAEAAAEGAEGEKKEEGGGGEEKKKRQTRGGKGLMKAKKKVEPQGIHIWTASRGKKKKVTIITGLASYGEWVQCVHAFRTSSTHYKDHAVSVGKSQDCGNIQEPACTKVFNRENGMMRQWQH
jgi:hypothetical protein